MQFLITDMYVLMLQLMLMGSAIFAHATESDREQHLLVLFPTWAIQGWWWWLGVRRLSRARVASRLRRAVFLGVAVPFAFGNFFLLAVLIPLYAGSSSSGSGFVVLAAFLLILFMVFVGCRQLAEWTAQKN